MAKRFYCLVLSVLMLLSLVPLDLCAAVEWALGKFYAGVFAAIVSGEVAIDNTDMAEGSIVDVDFSNVTVNYF